MRREQSGVMLLEALIAILIFSLGILGVVGLQASAVKANRDAKYRADAGLLANELVGQMLSGSRDGTTLRTNFQGSAGFVTAIDKDDPTRCSDHPASDGLAYCLWFNNRVVDTLPGALNFPPLVTVTPGAVGPPQTASVVSVTVRWRPPEVTTVGLFQSYRVVVPVI